MPENNQILSVEGQLVGMPLAGPESFSQQQLDYLKRALGVDETVLWENSTNAMSKDMTWPQSLSESINNFEKVQFWFAADTGNFSQPKAFEFIVRYNAKYSMSEERYESTNVRYFREAQFQINGTSLTNPYNLTINWTGASISGSNNNGYNTLYKVVGIHRISGGN